MATMLLFVKHLGSLPWDALAVGLSLSLCLNLWLGRIPLLGPPLQLYIWLQQQPSLVLDSKISA